MSSRFASVFRTGLLTPAPDAGPATQDTHRVDALAPTGRQTRLGALYAAPTLDAAARWARSAALLGSDATVHELRVPAETTFIYPVHAWETISWHDGPVEGYWATGIPLSRWLTTATANDPAQAQDWEVLVDPATLRSHRRVSTARLLAGVVDDFWRDQTRISLYYAARRSA